MLRVAICDDEHEVCSRLYEMLLGFTDIPTLSIDVFETGESLCNAVQGGKQYDLFILDIELKSTTGIQVGRFLRDELKQSRAEILFISGKSEYAMDLFILRPIDFLIKPLDPAKVHDRLLRTLALLERSSPYFQYSHRQSLNRIPYSEIMYFESDNKTLLIHMPSEVQRIVMQLSAVIHANPPPPEYFVQIHQSYLVNFKYLKKAAYSEVLMENGTTLPISYTYRRKVRERLYTLSIALRED